MTIKQWERAYAFLNEKQLEDPIEAIYDLAVGNVVHNDRMLLFEIFYAALQSSVFEDYDAETMADYLFCWQRMIVAMEAGHRLIELKLKEQFHYSYSGDVAPK